MKPKKQVLTWDKAGNVLTLQYPSIDKQLSFDRRKAAPLAVVAERHGWKQVLGDEESGGSPQAKYNGAAERIQLFYAGQWERDRGGPRPFDEATFWTAFARCGKDRTSVEAEFKRLKWTAEKRLEQMKAWAATARVKAALAEIAAEKAKAAAAAAEVDELKINIE